MKRWFLVIPLVLSLVWLAACTAAKSDESSHPVAGLAQGVKGILSSQRTGLWVHGEGKVSVAPDIAILNLGIEARADSVAEAQSRAREAMNRIKEVLLEKGIAEKDIQTTRFSIDPIIEWRKISPGSRKEVIAGYRVTHMFQVKIRDLKAVGSIIDAAVEAGGDLIRIRGVSFTIEDPSPYFSEARVKAVKDAQAKAREIAQALGIELGKPIYITESSRPPIRMKADVFEAAPPAPLPPTPISPGELEVRVIVQVVYEIK